MGVLRRGRLFNIWEQAIRASACQVAPNARLGTESRPATVPAALSAVSDQVPARTIAWAATLTVPTAILVTFSRCSGPLDRTPLAPQGGAFPPYAARSCNAG